MQRQRSPIRAQQYHLCVKVTPKVLSTQYFESSGIQSMFKLQIIRGNSGRPSLNLMKRNLHQEALLGFYKSQACYFQMQDYKIYRQTQFSVKLSEVNESKSTPPKIIFQHRFYPYVFIKDFIDNDTKKSTQIIKKDFSTEFYFNVYVERTKDRLLDRLRLDNNPNSSKYGGGMNSGEEYEQIDSYQDSRNNNNTGRKSISSKSNKSTPFRARLGSSTSRQTNFLGRQESSSRSPSKSRNGFYRNRQHQGQTFQLNLHERDFSKNKMKLGYNKKHSIDTSRSSPMRQYLRQRRQVNARKYKQNSSPKPNKQSIKKRFEQDFTDQQELNLQDKQQLQEIKEKGSSVRLLAASGVGSKKKPQIDPGRKSNSNNKFKQRGKQNQIYSDNQNQFQNLQYLDVSTQKVKTHLPFIILILVLVLIFTYEFKEENENDQIKRYRRHQIQQSDDQQYDYSDNLQRKRVTKRKKNKKDKAKSSKKKKSKGKNQKLVLNEQQM